MNSDEKTVPYPRSPAQLAYFEILRKGMKTFDTLQDDQEEELSGETDACTPDPVPTNENVDTKPVGLMKQEQS